MKNTFKYDNEEYFLTKAEYANGNLAIIAKCVKCPGDDSYDLYVSTNLGNITTPSACYVDTNNFPGIDKILEETGVAFNMWEIGYSGFCEYPLYGFDLSAIGEY